MSIEDPGPAPVEPRAVPITTGLRWGIKASFLAYITGQPGSQSSVSSGAALTSKRRYYFPLLSTDDYDVASGRGTVKFGGDVRFSGHFGMLFVAFIDPWITFADDGATLSIADLDHYPDTTHRLPLLDLVSPTWQDSGDSREWTDVSTTLRSEALAFFNDVYPPGQDFDAVDLRIDI